MSGNFEHLCLVNIFANLKFVNGQVSTTHISQN